MSFNNFYYQLTTGDNTSIASRVAGSNIAYVKKYVKSGGELSGHPAILVALINDADLTLIESEEPSSNFITIPSAQILFDHLEAAGMSILVDGTLHAFAASALLLLVYKFVLLTDRYALATFAVPSSQRHD